MIRPKSSKTIQPLGTAGDTRAPSRSSTKTPPRSSSCKSISHHGRPARARRSKTKTHRIWRSLSFGLEGRIARPVRKNTRSSFISSRARPGATSKCPTCTGSTSLHTVQFRITEFCIEDRAQSILKTMHPSGSREIEGERMPRQPARGTASEKTQPSKSPHQNSQLAPGKKVCVFWTCFKDAY